MPLKVFICTFCVTVLYHAGFAQRQITQKISASDLCFIENNGQFTDVQGNVDKTVQYRLAAKGMSILVGSGQLRYFFVGKYKGKIKTHVLTVQLKGANTNVIPEPGEKTGYYENYYTGTTEKGIKAFAYNKITYREIYPGIDWVLYLNDNKLEYDFVVKPSANVNDIRLQYKGAKRLLKDNNGSILARTPMGLIREEAPYCYEQETKKAIAASFSSHCHTLSFKTEEYKGTLVLDPNLLWGTYYGDSLNEEFDGLAADTFGNIYGATTYFSNYSLATPGSFQPNPQGATDNLIVKFDSSGTRAWATYYGGHGYDGPAGLACDKTGNIYLVGSTTSNTGIATPGAYKSSISDTFRSDAFLAKFSPAGQLLWGTYYGGDSVDIGIAIAISDSNYIYITGTTNSKNGIATPGTHKDTISGKNDVFLAKFLSSGARIWGTYIGGDSTDAVADICLGDSDHIYICGNTGSRNKMTTGGCYQSTIYFDGKDHHAGYICQFLASGLRGWSTYYGGIDMTCSGITSDRKGAVYVSGMTYFPTVLDPYMATQNAFQITKGKILLSKFLSDGKLDWTTYYTSDTGIFNTVMPPKVTCDQSGNVILTGFSKDTANIATPGNHQGKLSAGSGNAFVVKFTTNCERLWGTYYGGLGLTWPYSIVSDKTNSVYIGGSTDSKNLISTSGSFQQIKHPYIIPQSGFGTLNDDAFLAKFGNDTSVYIKQPFTDTLICRGSSFSIPYGTNGTFNSGNVFTVQLSDSAGKFQSPATIGSLAANSGPGTISCTFPLSLKVSGKYRVRIISSDPVTISSENPRNLNIIDSMPSVTVTSNSPLCTGDTLKLNALSQPGVHFLWLGPNGFTSSSANAIKSAITLRDSGTYTVAASVVGCTPKTAATAVSIDTLMSPIVTVTDSPTVYNPGDTLTFIAQVLYGGGTPTYQWYKNGTAVPGATTDRYITNAVTMGDSISVTVKSNQHCAFPDSATSTPVGVLDVNTVSRDMNAHIVPNPNQGNFILSANGILSSSVSIRVFNSLGQIVYNTQVQVQHQKVRKSIQLNQLTDGIYLLELNDGTKLQSYKFSVKQ